MLSEQFSQSGLSIDNALNNPRFAFGVAPALYTYLLDTFHINNKVLVKTMPEFLLESGVALNQQKSVDTKGGIYDIAMGYATNMDDKLYVGGSLGLSIFNYSRLTKYRESDPTGNPSNRFEYFELNDYLTTKGAGLNAKLGVIFKPADYLRFGLTLHSPTLYSLTDRQSSDIKVNTEGYNGIATVKSSIFTGGEEGITKYAATTPWKAIVSGSYVFREVNDTRRQRAFITADIEYVGYSGTAFKADGENVSSDDQVYYRDLKKVINDTYKGAVNFRLGGELKLHTIMFRAGGAYYSNPYRDSQFKSNIMQVSGGLGYRNHGMFIDLTYVHNMNKDVNFPYRLTDKANTFATQSGSRGNLLATVGFKF
jgi:long-subunit fatty acid transport protein